MDVENIFREIEEKRRKTIQYLQYNLPENEDLYSQGGGVLFVTSRILNRLVGWHQLSHYCF
jgi:hypothetical protein